jgi:hypothetical protein
MAAAHTHPRLGRAARATGTMLGLGLPIAMGAMLVRLGGFYPGSALQPALQVSGALLALLPALVVASEVRREKHSKHL